MEQIITVVDFLRHGEVNGEVVFRGTTDDPLTEQGRQQMARQCLGHQWDTIVSAPLRRCREFAEDWAEQNQVPLHIEQAWSEIDFGAWEGMSAGQIERQFPGQIAAFYADPFSITPAQAEPYREFVTRIRQGWELTLDCFAGKRILLVTHAGVIRALWSELFLMPPAKSFQIDVPHACMTRMTCFHGTDGRFVQLNFHKPL